jgi:hypothetical protein
MDVWYFTGRAGLRAVTLDETGSNLPEEHGPWQLLRNAVLPDGGSAGPVEEALNSGGYYLYATGAGTYG